MNRFRAAIVLAIVFLSGTSLPGQGYLNVDDVEVRWPRINIKFNIECNATYLDSFPRGNLAITDQGMPVKGIEFAPDIPSVSYRWHNTLMYCPAEAPASYALDQVKQGLHSYLDGMRSGDELAIAAFSPAGTVDYIQNFESDWWLLGITVDSLKATTGTSVLQAIANAVLVHETNPHPERTVIVVVTAGACAEDDGTLQTIINRAKNNRLRIYTVTLDAPANTADMRQIADETGGRNYFVPDPDSLADVMSEIAAASSPVFTRFTASYKATQFGCADFDHHSLHVELPEVCGATLEGGGSYYSSKGLGSNDVVRFALDTVSFTDTDTIALGIYAIATPIIQLPGYMIQLDVNKGDLAYAGIRTEGMALDGTRVSVQQHTTFISIDVKQGMQLAGRIKLCEILLTQKTQTRSYLIPEIGYVNLDTRCYSSIFNPGLILFGGAPESWYVLHEGDTAFCEGGSVTLSAEENLTNIRWSNGATTNSITVTQSGMYAYVAQSPIFGTMNSRKQEVIVYPLPDSRLEVHRDSLICRGEGTITWYMKVNNSWQVMPNESGSIIIVDPGEYKAKIVSAYGCEVFTESVTVSVVGVDSPPVTVASLDVYPLPWRNALTIAVELEQPSPLTCRISNALGEVVYSRRIDNPQLRFDLNINETNLPAGLYFLTITDGRRTVSRLIPHVPL